jgi:hypothetical protein
MPDIKKPSTASIDELLAASGVQAVTSSTGPVTKEATPEQIKEGFQGSFRAGDGRWLHRYRLDGQEVVLPKLLEEMAEEDFYALAPGTMDPQAGRMPQMLTVKFRDPQWAGRWFNRKAQDGRRVSEARALGYIPATRDDCEWVSHSLDDGDGAVIDNDLVLMKIHKAKLFFQYKQWIDLAKLKGGQAQYKQQAEGMVGGGAGNKVSHYLTPQTQEFHGVGPVTHIPTVS